MRDKLRAKGKPGRAIALPAVRKLRRRLTVIFALLTATILGVVLGIGVYSARGRAEVEFTGRLLQTTATVATELDTALRTEGEPDFSLLESRYDVTVVARVGAQIVSTEAAAEAMQGVGAEQGELLDLVEYQLALAGNIDGYMAFGESLDEALYEILEGEAVLHTNQGAGIGRYGFSAAATEELAGKGLASGGRIVPGVDQFFVYMYGEEDVTTEEVADYFTAAESVAAESTLSYGVTLMPAVMLADEAGNVLEGNYLSVEYWLEDSETFVPASILVMTDRAAVEEAYSKLWVEFGALFFLGLLLLVLASWFLAGLVMKPTVESLQRQAEFVAAASHELRSPLAVMRSSLSAARVAPDEEQVEKYQAAAQSEAERMSRLVDDLLLLAGGDAGNWKLSREPVDLDTMLIETHEQFVPIAKKEDVRLALELPEDAMGTVQGDGDRLRQVLRVLIDNALQYAPERSTVTLGGHLRKRTAVIEVADTGPGIPDESKARVFERFYRADTSRTDKQHFGLGLSVAKELTELHGGTLAVRDTPGGGATFRLELPVKDNIV